MVDQNKNEAQAAADAPAKVANAVANTAEKIVNESAKTAKRARAATARRAKRDAKPAASVRKARVSKTARKTRTAARKSAAAPRIERNANVNFTPNNLFAGFEGFTGAPFQSLFADAGGRGQEAVRRSQKAAEELAELTRANVEAIVEAARVAAEGARSLGQDVVARGRDGVEQTADAIRSLAEAKSPTEFVQLQSELARSSFDRLVADSSRFAESMVKLAGEAFQPLSNRATANTERFNNLVA